MTTSIRMCSLLLSAALTAQTTWVVDAGGGGHFLDVPPAIAAAQPGDRIVVQGAHTYSAFVVDRGVDVEAVAAAVVPTVEVVGVPAGERARVAGFRVQREGGVSSVSVRACAGAVLLVDLDEFGPAFQTTVGRPGLEIRDCGGVYVRGGTFLGQAGTSSGGAGALLDAARAVLVGGRFVGGVDVSTFPSSGNRGETGVRLQNGSHAVLAGVEVVGGSASQGNIVGGDGGDAVGAFTGSLAIVLAGELVGTPGGWGSWLFGDDGYAARGHVRFASGCALTGRVDNAATPIRVRPGLAAPAAIAAGGTMQVQVDGAPGQLVGLAADLAFGYEPAPAFDGAFVLTPTAALVAVLQLDGLGLGSWSLAVPGTVAARHRDVFLQAVAVGPVGLVLTAPTQTRTL